MITLKTNHTTIVYLNDILQTYIDVGQDMFDESIKEYSMNSSIASQLLDKQINIKLNAFPIVKNPKLKLYYFQAKTLESIINDTRQYFINDRHKSNTMMLLSNELNQTLS